MKARVDSARRTLGQRSRLALALLGLALVVLVVFVPGSVANLSPSTFNGGDGNMVVDGADTLDWANLTSQTPPIPIKTLTDTPSGQNDTSFSNGSTKESDTVANVGFGSIPGNKDDIIHAYLASQDVIGQSFLYLAWTRADSTGDAHVDFELDKNATPGWTSASSGNVTINRQPGDVVIAYDFPGSGAPDITAFVWDGSSWGTGTDLTTAGFAEAAVDHLNGPITDSVSGGSVGTDDFGETSVNLTAALGLDSSNPCATFGSVVVKTRASGSGFSAQLKDYIAPAPIHVSTCGSIQLKKHWEGKTGSTTLKIGTSSGGDQVTSKTVTADDATDAKDVPHGTYYVSESPNPVTNFSPGTVSCFNDNGAGGGTLGNGTKDGSEPDVPVGQDGSVSVNVDDVIVCTYVNTYVKANPTLATTLSASSVTVGATVHDSASFTGYRTPSSGTSQVTYTVYTDSSCTQNPVDAGTVDVNQTTGAIPNSNGIQFNTAGTYYWQASFGGDNDNNAVKSTCTEEKLVVNPASPGLTTVATAAPPTGVTVGSSVHDVATLSGGFNPTGSITFDVWNSTCTTKLASGLAATAAVNGNGQYTSVDYTPASAGTYKWVAHYSGDSNNNAADTQCGDANETSLVNKAKPTIATVLSSSEVTVGATVHDTSSLTGGTSDAGGTVTYNVYTDSFCTNLFQSAGQKTVTNGSVPESDPVTFTHADTYYWQAAYSGDGNNESATSPCTSEKLVVDKATPTVTTTLSDTSITVGGSVHDSATLHDASANAGGTVTYTVYDNSTCTSNANDVAAGVKTVTNGAVPESNPVTFSKAGDYYWQAVYSGDGNNVGAKSTCSEEHLVVNKKSPTIATVLSSSSITVGGSAHDTATLSGATSDAGGHVTYTVYSDSSCSQNARDAGTVLVTNGGVPNSSTLSFPNAGTFYWQAVYTGDGNNEGATSTCTDEQLVVGQASPTIATTLSDTSITVGGSVHDTAKLTGATSDAGGHVTYTAYSDSSCSQNARDAGTVTVTNGNVPNSNALTFNTAGDFYWQAAYTGDANNKAATSVCTDEHLVVNKATPTAATTLHNAAGGGAVADNSHLPLGSSLYDVASLTGVQGIDFSGTVTFRFFENANGTCTGEPVATQTDVVVSGTTAQSSTHGPLGAGSYAFDAQYVAGNDPSYTSSAVSDCEPFTIDKAQLGVDTLVHDAQHADITGKTVLTGSTVHDTATLNGAVEGFAPSGSITFTFYTGAGCELGTAIATDANPDAGSGAVRSVDRTVFGAGTYGFKATVADDANYLGATGACEEFSIGKADSTTVTAIHDAEHNVVTSVPFGSTVHDSASVSGGNALPTPTGSVSFTFFENGTCSGEGSSAGSDVALVSGLAHPSSSEGPLNTAGTSYSFQASYSGDENFNPSVSECEPLTVGKVQPSIATELSASEVVLGTEVHDSATLSGASSDAGGSVTYTVYDNNECVENENTRDAGTVAVTNGDVPDSNALLFNTAGDFYWQAAYSGDANNAAATSACTSEHLVVEHPAIAITKTPATQAVNSGGTASFTITVTNTGDVTLTNVTVTDPLSKGCEKTVGTLNPGQSTSYSCSQTGVKDPFTNVATATGHPPVGPDVTASASANVTVNPPPPPSGPTPTPTPVPQTPTVDLAIVKTASPSSVEKGKNVTYTLTVTNNGPVTDTSVQVADSLPAGVSFVSVTSSQGTCSGGNLVQCSLGTMTNGQKVTITILVNTLATGSITNTATVVGALPETTLSNNTSSTTINVTAPPKPKPAFKPPVVHHKPKPKPVVHKPVPPPCYAVVVAPKSLTVGKHAKLRLHVTAKHKTRHGFQFKSIAGVRVEVKGPGILKLSGRTNKAGKVSITLHPKKPGIVLVKPASYKGCTAPRIGVIAAFTPPVTG